MTTILIGSPAAKAEHIQRRFKDAGWEVRLGEFGRGTTEDELIAALRGVEGVISRGEPYTRRVLEAADRLRVISRTGVGYDSIDMESATARGIVVCTSVGSNDRTVADYAVMLMLALARRLIENHTNLKGHGRFERLVSLDFYGKTVGVIGVGTIGKHVARRVRACDCAVLGSAIVRDTGFATLSGMRYVPLDTLLRESDFVTLHVPLDSSTRHMIGEREPRLMKPTASLVNTARGPVIDQDALYKTLQERRIAGAGLDVFRKEPLESDRSLRALDNVILTSHAAGPSAEAMARGAELASENVSRVLHGQPPLSCVKPEVLRR